MRQDIVVELVRRYPDFTALELATFIWVEEWTVSFGKNSWTMRMTPKSCTMMASGPTFSR